MVVGYLEMRRATSAALARVRSPARRVDPRRRQAPIRQHVLVRLRTRAARAASVTLLIAASRSPLAAQEVHGAPAAPDLSFLAPVGAPSATEIAALENGEAVVRAIRTTDRDEVALLGLVSVAVPRDVYFASARNARAWLAQTGRQPSGLVGSPATATDFADATLDPADALGLRKCQVGRCSIKLSKGEMQAIANAVDWSTGDAERTAHVESLVREWLARLVTDYRARGDAALPVYDDTRAGEWSAAGFRTLLEADAFLFRDEPAFASYLAGSPARDIPGATSTLFWAVDRRPSLKPILDVSQLSSYDGGAGAPRIVAVKQIYASHYFDSWLDVTSLLEQPAPTPHTCLVTIRRVRFDHLPSRGLFDVRGRIVRKLREALHDELEHAKQSAEAAYHAP
jgi:hypothetical protein